MIMYGGKIAEYGPSDRVFSQPKHPYTQALLRAIPRLRGPIDRLAYIPGTPPDLRNPPTGCRFHPRCPKAFDRCAREEPPLFRVGENHLSACWLNEGEG